MTTASTPEDFEDYPDIPLTRVEFPSDALSIKRLRVIVPEDFDTGKDPEPIGIANKFFAEFSWPTKGWIFDLNEMLGFERVVAQEVFHRSRGDREPFGEDDEMRAFIRETHLDPARPTLERLYQRFRLADDPETARFLITLIEQQAIQLAKDSRESSRSPT